MYKPRELHSIQLEVYLKSLPEQYNYGSNVSVQGTSAVCDSINMSKRPMERKDQTAKCIWITAILVCINTFVWSYSTVQTREANKAL